MLPNEAHQRRTFLKRIGGVTVAAALPSLGHILATSNGTADEPLTAAAAQSRRFGDGRDWFFENRFGLFLHWGLYSIPAWHEQYQWRASVPRDQYVKLAAQWNPLNYDPEAWLDLAQKAGMRYVCFTTKHHDGFCLWNTKQTDYNTMNTPYGKDVLKMLADACHRRRMPLCLYYSCVDWHHPNYPNQGRSHELPGPMPGDQPDHAKYLQFVKAQVQELCTSYGEIHGFWWDMNPTKHVDRSINQMIRRLQPKAVISDRGYDEGDFGTPERDEKFADERSAFDRPVEACQSVGMESWGYRKDEDYYADRHLIRGIDRYLARGANYLLNVGPMADGTIPAEAMAILNRIGAWYHAVKESLEGVVLASHLTANRDVVLTRRGNTLYAHLVEAPAGEAVTLRPIAAAPRRATLLNTGQPIQCVVDLPPSSFSEQRPYLRLRGVPVNETANTVCVLKLEFDGNDLPQTS